MYYITVTRGRKGVESRFFSLHFRSRAVLGKRKAQKDPQAVFTGGVPCSQAAFAKTPRQQLSRHNVSPAHRESGAPQGFTSHAWRLDKKNKKIVF